MEGLTPVPREEFTEEDIAYANALFQLMGLPPEVFHLTGVRLADGEAVAMIYLDHGEGERQGMIPLAIVPTPSWFRLHVGEPDEAVHAEELMENMLALAKGSIPGLLREIGNQLAEQSDPEMELERLMREEENATGEDDEDDDEGFEGFGEEVG